MELVQSRLVTANVERMARFYAELVATDAVVNDYYVEIPAGRQRVGVSRVRFSDYEACTCGPPKGVKAGDIILDFATDDVDGEFPRIDALGVEWVMLPTLQPWGRVSMMFRDPEGHLVNVFSKDKEDQA